MSDIKDQIIEKLCEIAIHVGLAESTPTINNVIKSLRKAHCEKCDALSSELASLKSQAAEEGKEDNEIMPDCKDCIYNEVHSKRGICIECNYYSNFKKKSKQSDSTPDLCCGKIYE